MKPNSEKMKKFLKKSFTIIMPIMVLMFKNPANAEEQKFTIVQGKDNEMCREIADILREPENSTFMILRPKSKKISKYSSKYSFSGYDGSKLIFPKKYTNLSLPKWREVKFKDLNKYTDSNTLEWLSDYKSQIKKMEIAAIDFDDQHKAVKVLKTAMKDKNICDVGMNFWIEEYERFPQDLCYFFLYKGIGYEGRLAFHFSIYAQDIKDVPGSDMDDPKFRTLPHTQYGEKQVCMFTPN